MATPLHQFEGKYEILEKIAEGGMGALYKVRHRLLDEVRVIKVMRPQLEKQEGIKARFLREARLASKMRQTNIAQLYDFSMDESANAFIVMEFIDGITLQEMLQRSGPASISVTMEIAQQALLALDYLHRKKVVHRDISPDNFMITTDELGDPLVKLIDLGIAKALQAEGGLTATGMFVGKIRYASPEHFKPDEGTQVDQRSDLYSFGVVLYELLTGTHPIEGSNFSTLIAGHLFRPPVDFKVSDPGKRVPDDLRGIVLKALSKAPSDRFPNARAFREQILGIQARFPVDEACIEEVVKLRGLGKQGRPVSKPGSTQERINAEFQGTTPAPEVSGADPMTEAISASGVDAGVVPFATPGTEQEKRVEALLSAAERLVHVGLLAEARVQVQAVLGFDEDNVRARGLLERVAEKEKHIEAVARAVADVEEELSAGRPHEAGEMLDRAVAELGETDALLELRAKVVEAQEAKRAEDAAALATEAQALLADERFEDAISRLQEAIRLSPDDPNLQAQLAAATAGLRRHEGERRRAEAIAKVDTDVSELLEAGDLEDARSTVEKAVERLGEAPELLELLARVEEAEAGARADRVNELVETAGSREEQGDLEGAAEALVEALGVDPGRTDIERRIAELRVKADEARDLEQRLEEAVAEVAELIEDEDFAAGRRRLAEARERLGQVPRLEELEARLDSRERSWRSSRISTLVRSAQGLLADGDFAKAISKLEEAADLDPEDAGLKAQLEDSRRALEREREREREEQDRQQQERAREEREAYVRRVEGHLSAERAEDARSELDALRERFPDAAELEELERRVAELEAPRPDATRMMPVESVGPPPDDATRRIEVPPEAGVDDIPTTRLEAVREGGEPPAPAADATVIQQVAVPEPEAAPPEVSPSAKPPAKDVEGPPTVSVAKRPAAATARPSSRMPALPSIRVLAVAAAAVLLVVVLVVVVRGLRRAGPGPAPPTGTLVIAAAPWAEVVGVTDGDGNPVVLPDDATTPLRLALPPGHYIVTLSHPDRDATWSEQIELSEGETRRTTSTAVEMTSDDFLARYGL